MTFKHYRELACWQLSAQLRDEVIPVTERSIVRANLRFCDQISDSTRSAPSNIAEGFGRSNREFRRFLGIAMASLRESENHLDEAKLRKYVSPGEHARLRTLAKRAHSAAAGLMRYLRSRMDDGRQPEEQQPEG